MSRKDRERILHRQEILSAAEAVFAEKGFHRSTVEDVAARAEFSVGTLYKYFSGKEDLYQSLIAERFEGLSESAHALMDQAAGPAEAIKTYIELKIKLCAANAAFIRLYMRERMGDRFSKTTLWQERVGPLHERLMRRLTEAIAAGVAGGQFRDDVPPEDMAVAVDGLTDGFLFEWAANPEKINLADKCQAMVRMVFEGVQRR